MPDDGVSREATLTRPRLEERFVEARDGQRLFVRTWTPPNPSGGPPLVLTDGIGCQGYAWTYLVEAFRHRRRLVYWQYRGHGRSPVPDDLAGLSLRACVDDLNDVLEAVGDERGVLVGHSMGVQVVLETLRAHPHRVAGMVLMCGGWEHPLKTWHGPAKRHGLPTVPNLVMRAIFPWLTRQFLEARPELAQKVWSALLPTRLSYEIATRFEVNGDRIDERDFWPYLKHVGTMDMRVFAKLVTDLADHSSDDLLEDIDVPVLVVGAGRDTFTPVWLSEEMWRRIPDAEYLCIADGTHAAPIERPHMLNNRVARFLRERIDRTD